MGIKYLGSPGALSVGTSFFLSMSCLVDISVWYGWAQGCHPWLSAMAFLGNWSLSIGFLSPLAPSFFFSRASALRKRGTPSIPLPVIPKMMGFLAFFSSIKHLFFFSQFAGTPSGSPSMFLKYFFLGWTSTNLCLGPNVLLLSIIFSSVDPYCFPCVSIAAFLDFDAHPSNYCLKTSHSLTTMCCTVLLRYQDCWSTCKFYILEYRSPFPLFLVFSSLLLAKMERAGVV